MRVLHVSAPLSPVSGGPFESIRHLTKSLAEYGLGVSVAMPFQGEAKAHLDKWSAPVRCTGRVLVSSLGWSPSFGQSILQDGAELLHTHGLWLHPSWVALAWKRRWRRPHVVSVRGMLEPWAWRHHAWKKRPVWWLLERRNLESAALLHATSAQEARSLRERGLGAPIAIIPNGVELPRLAITQANGRLKGERKNALFLSRIHPKKGLPLLLEAWARVRPAGWDLLIAGPDEGGHRADLERQAGLLGLADVVRFSGPLTGRAKAQAFQDSDLFVLPTHSENFGIAVAEAMAHGLPVITTHGAPWQVLEQEQCGWWVPVSVENIAAALDNATRQSPEKLADMGRRGRRIAEERFSWDRIALDFIACYKWVLGDEPKPGCVV
ncbi:glycosyl transferase [Opitutaceae bacterium TAV5]|nr:glycosyl transferase [Opitutaceae bacterium TAV5]